MNIVLLGATGYGNITEAKSLEEVEKLAKNGKADIVIVGDKTFSSGEFTRDIVLTDNDRLYTELKGYGVDKVIFITKK